MKIMFKAESKVAGTNEWTKEVATEEEFDKVIKEEKEHYKPLGRLDLSLTVTACVVENGEVVYFNQLV